MDSLDVVMVRDFSLLFPLSEIRGVLGTGSFSIVLKVYDKVLDDEIAVKVI